jgi:hypothetical protein
MRQATAMIRPCVDADCFGARRSSAPRAALYWRRSIATRDQLGHANLGTTSIYLQGIDTEEIIATVHATRAPMMSATAGLRL